MNKKLFLFFIFFFHTTENLYSHSQCVNSYFRVGNFPSCIFPCFENKEKGKDGGFNILQLYFKRFYVKSLNNNFFKCDLYISPLSIVVKSKSTQKSKTNFFIRDILIFRFLTFDFVFFPHTDLFFMCKIGGLLQRYKNYFFNTFSREEEHKKTCYYPGFFIDTSFDFSFAFNRLIVSISPFYLDVIFNIGNKDPQPDEEIKEDIQKDIKEYFNEKVYKITPRFFTLSFSFAVF